MKLSSKNPALRRVQRMQEGQLVENPSSYGGIANKSIYFVVLTLVAAAVSFVWSHELLSGGDYDTNLVIVIGVLIGAAIVAGISAMVAIFAPSTTKVSGSLYALGEGVCLGFIAMLFYDAGYAGVVFAALAATVGTFLVMLVLYATGVVRVGPMFRRFVISALLGMLLVNLILFLVSLFSDPVFDLIYGNGALSIGISIIMVLLASFMILLDLDKMTQIVESGLDRKYEWIGAFGLLVTLIWLYMEFLRLFAKLADRK